MRELEKYKKADERDCLRHLFDHFLLYICLCITTHSIEVHLFHCKPTGRNSIICVCVSLTYSRNQKLDAPQQLGGSAKPQLEIL